MGGFPPVKESTSNRGNTCASHSPQATKHSIFQGTRERPLTGAQLAYILPSTKLQDLYQSFVLQPERHRNVFPEEQDCLLVNKQT